MIDCLFIVCVPVWFLLFFYLSVEKVEEHAQVYINVSWFKIIYISK